MKRTLIHGIESKADVSSQIAHAWPSLPPLPHRWNLSSASPTFEVSLEGHTDWINDLAHLPQHDLLASCSNDSTVRLWKASSDEAGGKVLHCLQYHSDYVTCLSAAPDKGLLCSAGLRGEVFTIDPETSTAHQMYPKSSSNQDRHASSRMGRGILGNPAHPPSAFSRFSSNLWGGGGGGADSRDDSQQDPSGSHTSSMTAAAKLKKQKGSIYALSCSPDGALIAFGGTDHIVRLWDPRTKTKVDKLRGHSDTLRALHLSPGDQGRQALSASSDGTVRLWDVGMRRCIEVRRTSHLSTPSSSPPSSPHSLLPASLSSLGGCFSLITIFILRAIASIPTLSGAWHPAMTFPKFTRAGGTATSLSHNSRGHTLLTIPTPTPMRPRAQACRT